MLLNPPLRNVGVELSHLLRCPVPLLSKPKH